MSVNRLEEMFRGKGVKAQGVGRAKAMSTDFAPMLDAASAAGTTASTASQMYGSSTSTAVLAAAFSGMGAINSLSSNSGASYGAGMGGTPYLTAGMGGMYGGSGASAQTLGSGNLGGVDPNAPVVAGTEGFSQMDMINTMNQNNLQLLQLQAVMQSNMQGWNTKSNILSADHRARMAMIEKFTAR